MYMYSTTYLHILDDLGTYLCINYLCVDDVDCGRLTHPWLPLSTYFVLLPIFGPHRPPTPFAPFPPITKVPNHDEQLPPTSSSRASGDPQRRTNSWYIPEHGDAIYQLKSYFGPSRYR